MIRNYIALRDTWLSNECRIVREGEEFSADFPEGMKLGENIKLAEPETDDKSKKIDRNQRA